MNSSYSSSSGSQSSPEYYKDKYIRELEARSDLVQRLADSERELRDLQSANASLQRQLLELQEARTRELREIGLVFKDLFAKCQQQLASLSGIMEPDTRSMMDEGAARAVTKMEALDGGATTTRLTLDHAPPLATTPREQMMTHLTKGKFSPPNLLQPALPSWMSAHAPSSDHNHLHRPPPHTYHPPNTVNSSSMFFTSDPDFDIDMEEPPSKDSIAKRKRTNSRTNENGNNRSELFKSPPSSVASTSVSASASATSTSSTPSPAAAPKEAQATPLKDMVEWHALLKSMYPDIMLQPSYAEKYRSFIKSYCEQHRVPLIVNEGIERKGRTHYLPIGESVRVLDKFKEHFPNPPTSVRNNAMLNNSVAWREIAKEKIGDKQYELLVEDAELFRVVKKEMRSFIEKLFLIPSKTNAPKPNGNEAHIRVSKEDSEAFGQWFLERYSCNFSLPGTAPSIASKVEPDRLSPVAKAYDLRTSSDVSRVSTPNTTTTEPFKPAHSSSSVPASATNAIIPGSSTNFVTKPGFTRYNIVLRSLFPNYTNNDREKRVEMKRAVKAYLQLKLGDQFDSCILSSQDNKSHTYGIPDSLKREFSPWAATEIKRIFDFDVIFPEPVAEKVVVNAVDTLVMAEEEEEVIYVSSIAANSKTNEARHPSDQGNRVNSNLRNDGKLY